MDGVLVTGKFLDRQGNPLEGAVIFTPQRLWVNHEGEAFATLHSAAELDEKGAFVVLLTPTHGHDDPEWMYEFRSPIGRFHIRVPESDDPIQVRDLVPSAYR